MNTFLYFQAIKKFSNTLSKFKCGEAFLTVGQRCLRVNVVEGGVIYTSAVSWSPLSSRTTQLLHPLCREIENYYEDRIQQSI